MPLNYSYAGPSDVPSYQLSAVPFVRSSTHDEVGTGAGDVINVKFPQVTRFFVVKNTDPSTGGTLKVGFTENGVLSLGSNVSGTSPTVAQEANFFMLGGGETTPRMEIRCKELFFHASGSDVGFTIMAGLSPVGQTQFPVLTGSEGYFGVG